MNGKIRNRKIKVAFFTHHSEIGGGEMSLFYMAKTLREAIDLIVVVDKKGPLFYFLLEKGIPVRIIRYFFSKRKLQFLRPNRSLRVIRTAIFLKKEKISLIHPNTFHDYLTLIPASRIARVPLLPFVRGMWENPEIEILKKANTHGLDVITVSEEVKNFLERNGVSSKVIRMGVVPEIFSDMKKNEVFPTPDANKRKVLCTITRISPEKGIERLLRAVRVLKERGRKDFIVWVVGSDAFSREENYKKKIISLVKRLGLSSYIQFLGFRYDVPEILKSCYAVVIPSRKETVGRSIQEAMAAGKPIVVSKTIELARYLKDSVDALLFDPNSDKDLADRIEKLLEDEDLARRMGESVQKRTELYDQRFFNGMLLELYRSSLAN